jgi:hypothetical protein
MIPLGVVHLEDWASSEGFRSRDFVVEEVLRLFLMLAAEGDSSGVEGRVVTSSVSKCSTEPGDIGSGVLQPLLASAWLFCRRPLRTRLELAVPIPITFSGFDQRFCSSTSALECRSSKAATLMSSIVLWYSASVVAALAAALAISAVTVKGAEASSSMALAFEALAFLVVGVVGVVGAGGVGGSLTTTTTGGVVLMEPGVSLLLLFSSTRRQVGVRISLYLSFSTRVEAAIL